MSDRTITHFDAETIANALDGRKSGNGFVARCPAHQDHTPSLSIEDKHGKVLLRCFSGCGQDAVLNALRQRGLWHAKPPPDACTAGKPASGSAASLPPSQSPQVLWDKYSPASSHPYLAKKCIQAHGARLVPNQNALVLSLQDTAGTIRGLQYISTDGTKKFLSGTTVKGHFFLVGDAGEGEALCIAEGFATAASIQEATGFQTATAFNATNLKPAAKALRHKWPERKIVLCADNDIKTSGNPGLTAARSAAQAVGGFVAVPNFGADRPEGATDFNDLAVLQGEQAVRDSIQKAISAFPALDHIVEETVNDPGYPFRLDVAAELGVLSTADPARYETLRGELKAKTPCRVTQLDRFLRDKFLRVNSQNSGDDRGSAGAPNMPNRLVAIALDALDGGNAVYLSTLDYQAFADLPIDGHRETWPVVSDYFTQWLTTQFFSQTGDVPGAEALKAAVNLISAQARFSGQQRPVFTRCGADGDTLYLDLCDKAWQCVEISMDGWQVIDNANSPARFRRSSAMDALPVPTPPSDRTIKILARDGTIEEHEVTIKNLQPFVNVASDEDFVLLVAWLLAALRSRGPYPVLVLSGEPGSAKSTTAKILRSLLDPSHIPTRVFPAKDEDLFLDASHNHLLAFDNLSSLSHAASDLLCQLATGGGFGRRQLYSNQDEFLLHASRPILLNGIENVAVRSDLADRAVYLNLEPVAEADRRSESELWASFEAERPSILGALLDALVVGLNRLPYVQLTKTPRMADFSKWAVACEPAFCPEGTFLAALSDNRQDAMEDVVSSDPVADSIRMLARTYQLWEGSVSELLSALEPIAGERTVKSKRWPTNASVLSKYLRRIAAALRRVGIGISFQRSGRGRRICISCSCGDGE